MRAGRSPSLGAAQAPGSAAPIDPWRDPSAEGRQIAALLERTSELGDGDPTQLKADYHGFVADLHSLEPGDQLRWLSELVDRTAMFMDPKVESTPGSAVIGRVLAEFVLPLVKRDYSDDKHDQRRADDIRKTVVALLEDKQRADSALHADAIGSRYATLASRLDACTFEDFKPHRDEIREALNELDELSGQIDHVVLHRAEEHPDVPLSWLARGCMEMLDDVGNEDAKGARLTYRKLWVSANDCIALGINPLIFICDADNCVDLNRPVVPLKNIAANLLGQVRTIVARSIFRSANPQSPDLQTSVSFKDFANDIAAALPHIRDGDGQAELLKEYADAFFRSRLSRLPTFQQFQQLNDFIRTLENLMFPECHLCAEALGAVAAIAGNNVLGVLNLDNVHLNDRWEDRDNISTPRAGLITIADGLRRMATMKRKSLLAQQP
jgi:hypothetical protein